MSSYNFDAPSYVCFGNDHEDGNVVGDDWFTNRRMSDDGDFFALTRGRAPRRHSNHSEGCIDDTNKNKNAQRDSCPSPRKKQKVNANHAPSSAKSTPRRSPRLNKPQSPSKPLSQKSKQLTRSTSHVGFVKPSANGKNVGPLQSKYMPRNAKGKTTEEMEMEKIAAMKEKLAATRKQNQKSYKAAISSKGILPLKCPQPATLPEDFNFQTDNRIRGLPSRIPEARVKDFTSSLRDTSSKPGPGKNKSSNDLTCPQPFKFRSVKSTTSLPAKQEFHSMAETVNAFYKKTPDRFKSKPKAKKTDSASRSPHLTIAKTPTLTTRARSRTVKTMSREEQEEAEFLEHQKKQFKAHPVNHKILAIPGTGVHKVPVKSVTVPEEFNLHQNMGPRPQYDPEEQSKEFHANPLNSKILKGPVGVKPVEPQALTIPQSPAFALTKRKRTTVQEPLEETSTAPPKSHHIPHAGIPFRPKLEHSHTTPEPFAVEKRSKEMLKKKEEKILQVYEEERKGREFHAQLLPSDIPDTLPPKQTRPATAPEPFHLTVDARGQRYQEEFKSKMEEELKHIKAQAEFKAGPNKVIFKEPFLPSKSSKPLTEVDNFELSTDIRAGQREQYNQHLKEHEAKLQALKKQIDERREHEENVAVAKLRQDMVHNATGIKKFKSVSIHPSEKPLTVPQSPCLRTQRINRKVDADQSDASS